MKKSLFIIFGTILSFCVSLFCAGNLEQNTYYADAASGTPFEIEVPPFNVEFYDEDGTTLLYSNTFEYGEVVYGGAELSKESTAAFSYEVTWQDETGKTVDLQTIYEDTKLILFFNPIPIDYTITYNDDGGAHTNPKTYNIGTESFTLARPNKHGYNFLGWTGTDLTEITRIVTIDTSVLKDREYTAHYEIIKYTVTFEIASGQEDFGTLSETSILVPFETEIMSGSQSNQIVVGEYTVTATPNERTPQYTYAFVRWDCEYDIVMGDTVVTIYFSRTENRYSLNFDTRYISVTRKNGTEVGLNDRHTYGTELTVTVSPTEHYHKLSFTLNDVEIESIEDNTVTITITQNSTLVYLEEIDKFNVSFSANNAEFGTVSIETLEVDYGTQVSVQDNVLLVGTIQVVATSNTETIQNVFNFVRWETNGVSLIEENTSFVAIFSSRLQTYVVTFDETNVSVKIIDGVSQTSILSGSNVEFGTRLNVSYLESEHYHKTIFKINGEDYSNNSQVVVDGNITITYAEEINRYTITFGAGVIVTNSGNSVSSGDDFEYGTELTAGYTLSKNYKVKTFSVNNLPLENNSNFTLTNNMTIEFVEEKAKIAISKAPSQNGTFTVPLSMEFENEVTIVAEADTYFKFSRAYYVTAETEQTIEIEGLKFEMPNEPVTVYVEFEREYYCLTSTDTKVQVIVKVAEFAGEPTLSVEEIKDTFGNYIKGILNSEKYVAYNLSLLVNSEPALVNDIIKIKIAVPESIKTENLLCLRVDSDGTENSYTRLGFTYNSQEGCVELELSSLGNIVVGERVSASGEIENTTGENKPKNNNIGIVIGIIAGLIAIATIAVIIIVVVKKKKKR